MSEEVNPADLAVKYDIEGVSVYSRDVFGIVRFLYRVEPEVARAMARDFTLASWECEELRRGKI